MHMHSTPFSNSQTQIKWTKNTIRNMVKNCCGCRSLPPQDVSFLRCLAKECKLKAGSVPNESTIRNKQLQRQSSMIYRSCYCKWQMHPKCCFDPKVQSWPYKLKKSFIYQLKIKNLNFLYWYMIFVSHSVLYK